MRACVAGGDGGDDGGAVGGGGGGGDGGDDDGGERQPNVLDALAAAGLEAEAVPESIFAALRAGRIGATELANWQTVQSSVLLRTLASVGYVRARLLAEPRLPSVLGIEMLVGSLSLLAAELSARGDRFLSELDFVLANQALILLSNAALVLALCPAARLAAPPAAGSLGAALASLPGYVLQQGDFSALQRLGTVVSKGLQFSAVGAASWSKRPYWQGHGWPPRAHQAAFEGFGLPSTLVRRGSAPQVRPRGRVPGATPRQTQRFRSVCPYRRRVERGGAGAHAQPHRAAQAGHGQGAVGRARARRRDGRGVCDVHGGLVQPARAARSEWMATVLLAVVSLSFCIRRRWAALGTR